MANLSPVEMQKLETLLSMSSGYVLNFSTQNFERFVRSIVGIDLNALKYQKYGTSKAKRLRALWEIEGNQTVGKLTEELINYYQAQIDLGKPGIEKVNEKLVKDCLNISYKLQGMQPIEVQNQRKEDDFLNKNIDETPLIALNLSAAAIPILDQRIIEVKKCLKSGASLSVIFLCGSILEGVLLNLAIQFPGKFNQAKCSPKDKLDKVRPFPEWSLHNLIDVSYELGYLKLDVKKHSHSLRDFRNYIHPFEQMTSGFNPDSHTAEINWKVLKAAMSQIQEKLR